MQNPSLVDRDDGLRSREAALVSSVLLAGSVWGHFVAGHSVLRERDGRAG